MIIIDYILVTARLREMDSLLNVNNAIELANSSINIMIKNKNTHN